MKLYLIGAVFLSGLLLGAYKEGDTISLDHQNMEFGYCYPESDIGNTFKLSDYNGELNGGNYKVILMEMSATW
ncbi:MAG: hypothetical protein QF472_05115 [Candidatus Marinimicrobia bacterium]|nr:hypothetical protein [Candidatus Neomarinimicrobiota bacterium]